MDFEIERKVLKKRRLSDPEPVIDDWANVSPSKRLEALEFLRRQGHTESYATETFKEFIELLEQNGVRYLIVGGYAVAAHGYPRYTGDIDLFVATGAAQAKAIVKTFRQFGFSDLQIDESDFLQPDMIVEIGREPLKIQVITGISGVTFEECFASRVEIEFGGRKLPFISFEYLIRNKSATKRGKDQVDVEELQKRRANRPERGTH